MMTFVRIDRWWMFTLASFQLLVISGCEQAGQDTASVDHMPTAPVEFAGCAQFQRGGLCTLSADSHLGLWIGYEGLTDIRIELAGESVDLRSIAEPVQRGWRVQLSPLQRPIDVTVAVAHFAPFRMRLVAPDSSESVASALQPYQRAGDRPEQLEASLASLDQRLLRADSETEQLSGYLFRLRAGVLLRQGRWSDAIDSLQQAILSHRQAGQRNAELQQTTSLAYFLIHRQNDFQRAASLLDNAPLPSAANAERTIQLARSRGDLSLALGDLRAAEQFFRQAILQAERVHHPASLAIGYIRLSEALAQSGRFDAARQLHHKTPPEAIAALGACDRARYLNSGAWFQLLQWEASGRLPSAEDALTQAAEILAQDCAYLDSDRSNVAINQALHAFAHGQVDTAESRLIEAEQLAVPPLVQAVWIEELKARIALHRGDPSEALQRYEQLQHRAMITGLHDIQWQAAIGRAEAQVALGNPTAAIVALEEADELLRSYLAQLPDSQFRAYFLARFERLPRLLVGLLIERNRLSEAWQYARRYRVEPLLRQQRRSRIALLTRQRDAGWQELVGEYRTLRQQYEEAAAKIWQVPLEQLSAYQDDQAQRRRALQTLAARATALLPTPPTTLPATSDTSEQLTLLYFPSSTAGQWSLMASNQRGLVHHALPYTAAELIEQPKRLLEPVAKQLESAALVSILGYGAIRQVDFHAIPWPERPLLSDKAVSYRVDAQFVPSFSSPGHQEAMAGDILLVADPSGDLPMARAEIEQLQLTFANDQAATVRTMLGSEITAQGLSSALTASDWFHYAGHADSHSDDTQLRLAGAQRFHLSDVLMLEKAPSTVVLAACESSRVEPGPASPALSLAHGFVLRGSHQVVATTRPVADETAARLMATFYRHQQRTGDVAQALVLAQRELFQAQSTADWSAFRLYTL